MTATRLLYTLRAEWTKALTLRSIQGAIVGAVLGPVILAVASGVAFDSERAEVTTFPIESHGFETAGFGQPLIILLAALITGTEYVDGQIRATFVATPKRGSVFTAKFFVIGTMSLLIGLLATSAAVVLKHLVLGEHGLTPSQFTVGMGWNLVGVAVNYMLLGLIAGALTVLVRTFVVTLVVLLPMVLGVTISLLGVIPALKFLPDLAGIQLLTPYPGVGLLDPIPGGIVMATWTVLLVVASWLVFRRRDTNA